MNTTDLPATTARVPLEAALHHPNGAHWGWFGHSIIEMETAGGLIGHELLQVEELIEDGQLPRQDGLLCRT